MPPAFSFVLIVELLDELPQVDAVPYPTRSAYRRGRRGLATGDLESNASP